ncbi:MAG TPA: ferritin family protein [Thermoanaerobaculia bacterium]|nr:ferritin family protein [Thermoanaerobaculia bacterium]
MKPLQTTVEEVLRTAIQSEVETRVFYQRIAERTSIPEVKSRLLQLADNELLHRAKLERRYREEIGSAPPDPLPETVELPSEIDDLDMKRALKICLERERDSESYFRFMAERAQTTDLLNLFLELAEFEWKHKTDLQAEYDRVTASDPEQFLRDI